jgi:threonine dehydrogenase-like Zn-dependent dehydrogenase
MKAAVYYGPGDIRIEEIDRPKAEDGVDGNGIVVKIAACGITDTMDLPAYRKGIELTVPPIVMGYEWGGEVVEVGPKVTAVKVGDRVHTFAFRPCLKCGPCLAGNYAGCNNYREAGAGHRINGALAEYMLVPFVMEDRIVKLPDGMTYHDATLLILTRLCLGLADKVNPGDVVVIQGAKFLALGTLIRLKQLDIAKKIIVTDISNKRLEKARELGADVVINEETEDVVDAVMKETSGLGAQVVIECTGSPANFLRAVQIAAEGNVKTMPPLNGGTVWLPEPYDEPVTFTGSLLKGGAAIRHPWGTIESSTLTRAAFNFIKDGHLTGDMVVSHVFPLDKTKEAFETLWHDPDVIKVVIEP